MNIRDIAIGQRPELRRVGVTFPHRHQVVKSAKRLYMELGVPVEIDEQTIYLNLPRASAAWFMGLMERATGHMGFSEWNDR